MRGQDEIQESWFSYVSLEERIPKSHPLRKIRLLVDGVLKSMGKEFSEHYSHSKRSHPIMRLSGGLRFERKTNGDGLASQALMTNLTHDRRRTDTQLLSRADEGQNHGVETVSVHAINQALQRRRIQSR